MIKHQTPPPKTIILETWDEQVITSIQVPLTMLFFLFDKCIASILMCGTAAVLS